MVAETTFDIHLQNYSTRRLSLEAIGAVQALREKCLGYMLLVDGRPAYPNEVERAI